MGLLAERLPDQLEARAPTEPVIDQVDVVVTVADQLQRLLGVGRPLDLAVGPVLLAEQVPRAV